MKKFSRGFYFLFLILIVIVLNGIFAVIGEIVPKDYIGFVVTVMFCISYITILFMVYQLILECVIGQFTYVFCIRDALSKKHFSHISKKLAKDVVKETEKPALDELAFIYDILIRMDISESKDLDRVYFYRKKYLYTFKEFISSCFNINDWIGYKVLSCNESIEIKGKNLKIVPIRNEKSDVMNYFVDYNNTLYKLPIGCSFLGHLILDDRSFTLLYDRTYLEEDLYGKPCYMQCILVENEG